MEKEEVCVCGVRTRDRTTSQPLNAFGDLSDVAITAETLV